MKQITKLNWRTTWYSVIIWLLAFLVAGFVIVPWFYLALAIVILLTTIYYFKILNTYKVLRGRKKKFERDRIFALGLVAALFWFFIVAFLNFLQIIGFYYFDFFLFFSDFRNWYLFALILLIPVVYSLILENARLSQRGKKKHKDSYLVNFLMAKQARV